ncbi:hypothetical protein [Pseudomonas sp.]|uniref:hypothetical protein n=1 Tax=Pseudomonas sp. TaxID=306 RepID=UPI0028AF58C0|nr:hypothetical protein [Pseudomonas sp.]
MSVTSPTGSRKKSGNRETNRQIVRLPDFARISQTIDFKGFEKVGTAPAIALVQQQEKRDNQ